MQLRKVQEFKDSKDQKEEEMTKMLLILSVLGGLLLTAFPVFAQSVDTAWVRIYNGPGNSDDGARSLWVDNSGNIYLTGFSTGSVTGYDYLTIKYYPDGDTAWVRRYNGPGNDTDEAFAIVVDDSGNVYVTGNSSDTTSSFDYLTIKYSPDGVVVWAKRYDGPGNSGDQASAMAIDGSGNIYVTGVSQGSVTGEDYASIKYYPNGDTAWVRRYDRAAGLDGASAIAIDGSGNVYVTGASMGTGTSYDYATVKYYSNGDTAWVRRYNGSGNIMDYASAIAVDDSGNVYVTGTTNASGASSDFATIRYYPNGDVAWVRTYNGPGNDMDDAFAIAVDDSNNVYVVGQSWGVGTWTDYAIIKYKPNGDTDWERKYDGPGNNNDRPYAVAIDGSGNVYVTGFSEGSGTNYDCTTIKYYPNGDTVWVRRYNGPVSYNDYGSAIAVDGSRNVYVTGYGSVSEVALDCVTIKYVPLHRDDTLNFTAYSPVDLIVTDPIGDSIGIDSNTIPGATYDTLTDYNGDEELDDRVTIPEPLIGDYTVRVVGEPGSGGGSYTLAVKLNGNEDTPMVSGTAPGPGEVDTVFYMVLEYLRGDANSDGSTSISDVIFLINYLFKGGTAPEPLFLGDVNCDGNVTVADVVYIINYLFKGGKAPCS